MKADSNGQCYECPGCNGHWLYSDGQCTFYVNPYACDVAMYHGYPDPKWEDEEGVPVA
jgi:hypothetical protein